MSRNTYKDLLEELLEHDESGIVVISGYGDLVLDVENPNIGKIFKLKDLTEESFWIKFGRADSSQVLEALRDCNEYALNDNTLEGEYSFDMIFKWYPGEYHEHGLVSPGFLDLKWTEWKFLQTFQQREREVKLDIIFNDDFNRLFD